MKNEKILVLFCYLTLYIVWGSTYFFIKMAVETIPPLYVVGLRFASGGALLLILAYLTGHTKTRPTLRQILASILLGALLLFGGGVLITIAEQTVDSYITALIIASTPMVVAFFDRVLLDVRISSVRLSGIVVGITGVALLLYNGRSLSASLSPEILMVIGGVGCWGLATSLGHRIKTYPDPLVNSSIQMLFSGIACLIGASFAYPPLVQILPTISVPSWLGLLYLAIIGTLAFAAYTYLVAHEPAIRLSSYALVNPVIATLLGLLVGNETPAPFLATALPLVLIGVAFMLYGETAIPYLKKRLVHARTVTEDQR